MRKSRLLPPWDLDSTCSSGYCQQRAGLPLPHHHHQLTPFLFLKVGNVLSVFLSSFRCLQEDPEIWDIPWKLCSPGVSGLRGNSESTQDGVGNRALMGGREDSPLHTPLPQDLSCWHLQTSPAVFPTEPPLKPPGLIPTHLLSSPFCGL